MQSIVLVLAGIGMIVAADLACAQNDVPVRNETLRADDREVIMMRHAYLDEGSYDYWYQQSATGVWPWFERLSARILGDFEIIYPLSEDQTPGQDEALRFARYASYEHWQATGVVKAPEIPADPCVWPVTGDSAMPAQAPCAIAAGFSRAHAAACSCRVIWLRPACLPARHRRPSKQFLRGSRQRQGGALGRRAAGRAGSGTRIPADSERQFYAVPSDHPGPAVSLS